MASTIEEITAKLEEEAKPSSESPTDQKETVVEADAKETDKGKGKGSTAQARIQELVEKSKGYEDKLKALEERLSEKDSELGKLIDLVKDREQDSRVVAKINELYASNPDLKEDIERLDAAIKGLEVPTKKVAEVKGAETPKPGEDLLKGIQGKLEAQNAKHAAEIADQRSELLLTKTDLILDKLFAQLPSADYSAEDQKVLNSAIAEFVDWTAIEENPALLDGAVAKGFQEALDWYGTPKGRLAAQAATKETDTGKETKSDSKPVDFSKLDFGKLNSTPDGKKAPAISDAEFAAMMGEALKRERGGR